MDRGQVTEGVAHNGLEEAHTGVEQWLELGDGAVTEQAVNAVVHQGRLGRLERQRLNRSSMFPCAYSRGLESAHLRAHDFMYRQGLAGR
jgi:hypothetical protein